nr:protein ZBED8-like [Parasteatoda tepidariorum]
MQVTVPVMWLDAPEFLTFAINLQHGSIEDLNPIISLDVFDTFHSDVHLRRVLDHRLFKTVCQEMDAEHEVLLYHTELRWLSRGQALKQFFMLKIELSLVLEEKDNSFFEYLSKKDFTYKLAYLADNFNHMNNISLLIQGPDITIMDATEKLQAF